MVPKLDLGTFGCEANKDIELKRPAALPLQAFYQLSYAACSLRVSHFATIFVVVSSGLIEVRSLP